MRAAVYKGVGKPMAIESLADPTPSGLQVVVRTGRCGICASDLNFTDGSSEMFCFPAGIVLGHEYAGEVVAVGSEVTRVKVGDPVACMPVAGCGHCEACRGGRQVFCAQAKQDSGGYAQYVLNAENALVRLPKTLSMSDGALIEPLAVALRGVMLAGGAVGARVVVTGVGPIGLGAIYWARRLGASSIAAVGRSRRREDLAMIMGADHFLLSGDERGLPAAVSEVLGGPPDIVVECVGAPGALEQAIGCARPGGIVASLGCCIRPDTLVPAAALFKEVRIQFSMLYDRPEFEQAARALDAGHLEPRAMLTATVGLDDFPAQFEALRTDTHHCKVMLDPWRDGK